MLELGKKEILYLPKILEIKKFANERGIDIKSVVIPDLWDINNFEVNDECKKLLGIDIYPNNLI